MTKSTITRDQLRALAVKKVESLKFAITQSAFTNIRRGLEEELQLAKFALAAMDSEPVAYMTYKGYLLHAGDPKLAEYSEPTPLYADPRTAAMPAAPVAWLWSRDDERDVSLTPPDDDDDAADAIECGWTATPLYRHAQQSVVQKIMARLAYLLDEDQFHNIESMVLAAAPQPAPVVPEDVLDALQKMARIRLDMNDFDGDRRGIDDCLGDAEEALIEVVNRRAAMLAADPQEVKGE